MSSVCASAQETPRSTSTRYSSVLAPLLGSCGRSTPQILRFLVAVTLQGLTHVPLTLQRHPYCLMYLLNERTTVARPSHHICD